MRMREWRRKKSYKERTREVAIRLLEQRILTVEEIAQISGLPVAEIKELQLKYGY